MAGLNSPFFKPSVKANRQSTKRKSIFYDVKADTSVRLRVLPPTRDDGMIFTVAYNHFNLKNDEGFGTALACLNEHGDESEQCLLCQVVKALWKTKDKGDAKLADKLNVSPRWYLQAFVYEDESYKGPYLVGVSRTTADQFNDLMDVQEDAGVPLYTDIDEGTDVIIARKGSGLKTKYNVQLFGTPTPLEDMIPGFMDKVITDVYGALDLKIEDRAGQQKALARTFGDELDLDALLDSIS